MGGKDTVQREERGGEGSIWSEQACVHVHENIALNFINTYSQYVLVRKEN